MRGRPLLTILTLVIVVAPWVSRNRVCGPAIRPNPRRSRKLLRLKSKQDKAHDKNSHPDSVNKLDSSQDKVYAKAAKNYPR